MTTLIENGYGPTRTRLVDMGDKGRDVASGLELLGASNVQEGAGQTPTTFDLDGQWCELLSMRWVTGSMDVAVQYRPLVELPR